MTRCCYRDTDARSQDPLMSGRAVLSLGGRFNERGIPQATQPDQVGNRSRHIPCLLLSVEALSLAMATREDRAMTNVQLWILLWQKQIIDKHQRAGAAA
jgi:RES domain-containing protein